jgi:hypothetical protein
MFGYTRYSNDNWDSSWYKSNKMSVMTTADTTRRTLGAKLAELRELLVDCHDLCDQMIDPDVWGGDEWNQEFLDNTDTLMNAMLEVRKLSRFV